MEEDRDLLVDGVGAEEELALVTQQLLRHKSHANIALLLGVLSSAAAARPRAAVAARGARHSLQGQAQPRTGIMVDKRILLRARGDGGCVG